MALSSYKYALIAPRLEKVLAQNAAPKVPEWQSYGKFGKVTLNLASHAGVFRGARISSLLTNACSTENNIPFSLFYLRGR